ncbi:hypothetical protein PsB1_0529 [Candidatus Phycosocius spiralis]|uniref:DUF3576 domain-containing protein n=2 Tax=Candidatus Phycosocius spiralis TaxID=2815099 RepID=A0ABQ4PTM8_9PROT|nr:hypothetical protein PsB1_0529 [Candidatus Phycosocius spiralis]
MGLGGCASRAKKVSKDPAKDPAVASASVKSKKKSNSNISPARARRANPTAQIGVNAFLWRATLDTLDFLPLLDSDPFGGTYVTDWHSVAEKPDERFKVQVYILDTRLRADGLSVQVFRQTKDASGGWVDASVDPDTSIQIENAILTRARQLRIAQLESK